jgi:uncharacterized OB-fold protein
MVPNVIPIRPGIAVTVARGVLRMRIDINRCPRCSRVFVATRGHDCPNPPRPVAASLAA